MWLLGFTGCPDRPGRHWSFRAQGVQGVIGSSKAPRASMLPQGVQGMQGVQGVAGRPKHPCRTRPPKASTAARFITERHLGTQNFQSPQGLIEWLSKASSASIAPLGSLWRCVELCGMVLCCVVFCGVASGGLLVSCDVWCSVMWVSVVWCSVVWCGVA